MRRPSTKKTEELGVLAVQHIINNMNYQLISYSPDISGFDGEIQLTDAAGELTPQLLKCQIKSGPSYIANQTEGYLTIRIPARYVEMWRRVMQPVLLFYYDVASETVYWLSVKEYLTANATATSSSRNTILFTYDKVRDVFTEDCRGQLWGAGEGRTLHDRPPELKPDESEPLYTNWFAVESFPQDVYFSPTASRVKENIARDVTDRHALVLKEGRLFSFVDPRDDEQLVRLVGRGQISRIRFSDVERLYKAELLNAAIHADAVFRGLRRLRSDEPKYGFPLEVLRGPTHDFAYQTLSGHHTQRKLVYVSRARGERHTEYRRHALSMSFTEMPSGWFLELDPYMDYAYLPKKGRRETGAAITAGIQSTFNYQYLLLLRFWQQFLSGGTDRIRIRTEGNVNSPAIVLNARMATLEAQFSLTKDPLAGGLP
jgi:hypothetical protein